MNYLLGIDQSTQGTKCIIFSEEGNILYRYDLLHQQIVNKDGWISHDLNEIYKNVIEVVKGAILGSNIDAKNILGVGITNQRETTGIWDKNGTPLDDAIVWQCQRAQHVSDERIQYQDLIYERTGLPLSPYFPAAKMKWLLNRCGQGSNLCLGTIDAWLIYKLTNGKSFYTDYSNASRTQLFNIKTLTWDDEICKIFGIDLKLLPKVLDSNACFGYTDFAGVLPQEIPIHAIMGDSHSALYAQGCHTKNMVKATYGTGSSIMMNTGTNCCFSKHGLSTSLAWSENGKVSYVLEGNVNYAGAIISWLKDDLELISSPKEVEKLALDANPNDTTVLIPAFSGLGAPYWFKTAKACIYGMSRTTKKAELVRASLESIAYQIQAVLSAMEQDSNQKILELRADGGPTKNAFLMQFQSNLANTDVLVSNQEELSALGVVYMAGISMNFFQIPNVFAQLKYNRYQPSITKENRELLLDKWIHAIHVMDFDHKNPA